MSTQQFSLVADIGGTNARFALVDDQYGQPVEPCNLRCAEYPTVVDAVRHYLDRVNLGEPCQAAISVASPVTGDTLHMMNHSWSFSVNETRKALGLQHLKVLNDYTALALALPCLMENQCMQVGSGSSLSGHPIAVLGPGTGLGVSGVIPVGDHWVPLESEGGHVTYGPVNERERQIMSAIADQYSHISAESLVSGPGLALLYETITRIETGEGKTLHPSDISNLALNKTCDWAVEALTIFCDILGSVAGNLALTLGARGGVYIGGGIVLKIIDAFVQSGFRHRFEQHGRLTGYLQQIPTYVINTDYPALTGAVVSLAAAYDNVGVVSRA